MPSLARLKLNQYGGDRLPAKGVAPGLGLVYGDTSAPPAQQRHAARPPAPKPAKSAGLLDRFSNWLKQGQYISRGLSSLGAHGLAHKARQHGYGAKKKKKAAPKRKPKIRTLLL